MAVPENYHETRKLVVENPQAGIRYFLVKPSDVTIYVEHGAADVGIVGKDILEESGADVYELLDTGLGRCDMCVAAGRALSMTQPHAACCNQVCQYHKAILCFAGAGY